VRPAVILAIVAFGASLVQPQVASASTTTADGAVLRTNVVATSHPGVFVIRARAENLGPDPMTGGTDSFDVHYLDANGMRVRRELCDNGISPDTPYCEYGDAGVGQTFLTKIRAKVTASPASVTFCVTYEGTTVDPDLSNNCMRVTI
jgi:hypothetical protein